MDPATYQRGEWVRPMHARPSIACIRFSLTTACLGSCVQEVLAAEEGEVMVEAAEEDAAAVVGARATGSAPTHREWL